MNNLGHFPCSSDTLTIEVIGLMGMSRYSRIRKLGKGSREHDFLGELRKVLSFVTLEKVVKVGGGYLVMYLGVKNVRDVKLSFQFCL